MCDWNESFLNTSACRALPCPARCAPPCSAPPRLLLLPASAAASASNFMMAGWLGGWLAGPSQCTCATSRHIQTSTIVFRPVLVSMRSTLNALEQWTEAQYMCFDVHFKKLLQLF